MHTFTDFHAYKRNLAKPLYMFMENVWLLEPALKVYKNMTACRNKVPQMREHILLVTDIQPQVHVYATKL